MKNNESETRSWPHTGEAEKALLGCIVTGASREQEIGLELIMVIYGCLYQYKDKNLKQILLI